MAWQLSQDTRDRGESQTNQEEHRATLSDEQLEQSSLVLPGGNWFWCQGNRVQGACWIDRTGRAEGNSLGEGENQTELAACCTGPALKSETQRRLQLIQVLLNTGLFPLTGRHLRSGPIFLITPHPSCTCVTAPASGLALVLGSLASDRWSVPGSPDILHTWNHHCSQKCPCHEKCTKRKDPTHQQLVSLLRIALQQCTQQPRPSNKEDYDDSVPPAFHLATLGSPERSCAIAGGARTALIITISILIASCEHL